MNLNDATNDLGSTVTTALGAATIDDVKNLVSSAADVIELDVPADALANAATAATDALTTVAVASGSATLATGRAAHRVGRALARRPGTTLAVAGLVAAAIGLFVWRRRAAADDAGAAELRVAA